ncbi:hypothetical protein [Methylorubrum zatmanii]|uniref:Neuroendocrine-specific golgi family protein P55 (NESP55) n=1 Tax=Methylorubrum zatmanii TaxID=29429 RepID=A0ABW1WJD3_9HYPH|nr:hypothetical protein [Methylorubrum zatmanii]MBD8905776.1 hypothetical protein [Methylorubrum zatmanii]
MRQYLVTFHKIVPDDHGRDHRILQRCALVTARSEVAALYEAKAQFCAAMRVIDWRLSADSCDVTELTRSAA